MIIFTSKILARQMAEDIDDLLVANNIEQPRRNIRAFTGWCPEQPDGLVKEPTRVKVSVHLTDNLLRILYHGEICCFDLTTGKKILHGSKTVQKIAPLVTKIIIDYQDSIKSERETYEEYKDWHFVMPTDESADKNGLPLRKRVDENTTSDIVHNGQYKDFFEVVHNPLITIYDSTIKTK